MRVIQDFVGAQHRRRKEQSELKATTAGGADGSGYIGYIWFDKVWKGVIILGRIYSVERTAQSR